MSSYKVFFCLLIHLFFISCDDRDTNNTSSARNEMIIGLYFGECIGDCATFYRLDERNVYADVIENGYSEDPAFSSESLNTTEELLNAFIDLENQIPTMLINNEEDSYGCPDCGDWGAIGFIYQGRRWTLDNSLNGNPDEIQAFVAEIQRLVMELSAG